MGGQKVMYMTFQGSRAWTILSPIEQQILQKIETVGTPLKEWNVSINRGVLTGYNEAFLISSDKRNEILAKCLTAEERTRTAAIIRPILRGRDIKRYGYEWAGLYLIYIPWHFPLHTDTSIQGASEKAEIEFKRLYPSIYQHLSGYKKQLEQRNQAETGIRYEWYAMQRWGANYSEDFLKPKIIYSEIVQGPQFYLDQNEHFLAEATAFILCGEHLEYLVKLLNSKTLAFIFKKYYAGGGLGEKGYRYKKAFLENLPIPKYQESELCSAILDTENEEVEQYITALYGFSEEEKEFI